MSLDQFVRHSDWIKEIARKAKELPGMTGFIEKYQEKVMQAEITKKKENINTARAQPQHRRNKMDLDQITYIPFPKIPRLFRECVITEKLDGTNAQIVIDPEGNIRAGSRTRWINPGDDNFGFASWVHENQDNLRGLGEGHHFGEWWGFGIQRNYDLTEKRFSLFNTNRWSNSQERPTCCGVVPILYEGVFDTNIVKDTLENLKQTGSIASPGYMKPEGVIVYMKSSNHLYKVLIENDEKPKGKSDG